MNKNNHTLLAALIALSLIAGFTTYFVSPDLNKTVAQKEGERVTTKFDSTTQLAHEGTENSTITNNWINNAQSSIDMQQTNIKGLFAAGDVQNPYSGALEAAFKGGMAATSIVHEWLD